MCPCLITVCRKTARCCDRFSALGSDVEWASIWPLSGKIFRTSVKGPAHCQPIFCATLIWVFLLQHRGRDIIIPLSPQAWSQPPALSSPGTMGKLCLGTYMATTFTASQKAGAVFSQRKALEQGVAEGQFRRQCCPQLEHCSREVPAVPWDRWGHPPAAGTPSSPSSCYDIVLLLLCFSLGAFSSSLLPHPATTRQRNPDQSQEVWAGAGGRGKHMAAPPLAEQCGRHLVTDHQQHDIILTGTRCAAATASTSALWEHREGDLYPQLGTRLGTDNSSHRCPLPERGKRKRIEPPPRNTGGLSHRHLQAQLCDHRHSKHHTQPRTRGRKTQKIPQLDLPHSNTWDCLLSFSTV